MGDDETKHLAGGHRAEAREQTVQLLVKGEGAGINEVIKLKIKHFPFWVGSEGRGALLIPEISAESFYLFLFIFSAFALQTWREVS